MNVLLIQVEPIPDHDWVGETWGLYFSDYEDELLKIIEQDPHQYIRDCVDITTITDPSVFDSYRI